MRTLKHLFIGSCDVKSCAADRAGGFPATAVVCFLSQVVLLWALHLHVSTNFLENIFTPRFTLASEIRFLLQLELCDVFAVKPTRQVGPEFTWLCSDKL